MRLRRLSALVVCALVIGALVPASGFAGFYNSSSTSADAWWSNWDWNVSGEPGPGDATLDWNVSGFTGKGVFKDAGSALDNSRGSMGWASMNSYTPAQGESPRVWTEFSCVAEPPGLLVFGKKLGSAKLEFVAEGTLRTWIGAEPWIQVSENEWELREPDETSAEMVSVIVDWKAIGAPVRYNSAWRERSLDSTWSDRSVQTSRKATADASIVGASGMVYLQPDSTTYRDAQLSQSNTHGRFTGQVTTP